MALSFNCVNAADNETQDILTTNEEILLSDSGDGTFTELNDYISSHYGQTITLNKSYVYDETKDSQYSDGITIRESITINGDNFSIDGNGKRIFTITGSNIVLNNITFKNAANNAIYVNDDTYNLTINNSYFKNNSVVNSKGGAIYWDGENGTLDNSVFEANHLLCKIPGEGAYDFDGGAVYWGGANGTINNTRFTENYAFRDPSSSEWAYVEGGALYWGGDNGTLVNSVFDKNYVKALNLTGGYEHIHSANGGAVYWNGNYSNISNVNFTRNNASRHAAGLYMNGVYANITYCNFFNNTASMEAGALKIHKGNATVEKCNFTDNCVVGTIIDFEHTETIGGAMYISRGTKNTFINECYYRGNNATNGSAIYINTGAFVRINSTTFVYNQAKSRLLNISQNQRNFTSTFYGNDNIGNTIWNNNNPNDDAYLKIDGVSPVLGVEHSHNGERLYQDDREFSQNITVNILDESDNVLYTTKLTTDLYGQVNFTTYNGKKLQFIHENDVYYTEIVNTTDIPEIIIMGEDKIAYAGQKVTVPISLKDIFGENITNGTVTVQFENEEPVTYDASSFEHEFEITAPDIGEYTLHLTYTDPYAISITNTSRVIVKPIILNINKTANVTTVGNNSLVNFTIVVNNTSIFNVTEVVVGDLLPETLTLSGFDVIDLNGAQITYESGVIDGIQVVSWKVSNITSGNIVSFWVVAITNTVKENITNNVYVYCSENRTFVANSTNITVVPVKLNINKTANVTAIPANAGVYERNMDYIKVNFTISVNSSSLVNATDVVVTDNLESGLSFTNAGYISSPGITVNCEHMENGAKWIISNLDNRTNVVLWITAIAIEGYAGNVTNSVNVTCKENRTAVSNKTNVSIIEPVLLIKKIANVTYVGNNSLVNYTIIVNNTSIVDAIEAMVGDVIPQGLIFKNAGFIAVDGVDITWIKDSRTGNIRFDISKIPKNSSLTLWVEALTNGSGNISNIATVGSTTNFNPVYNQTNITIVDINLTVNKTADITTVANNTLVNFTIIVNNTAKVNATLVNVIDKLPEGLVFEDAGFISVDDVNIEWKNISDNIVQWNISKLANNSIVKLWIAARTNGIMGNLTNNVNVNCNENRTNSTACTNITVVPVVLTVSKTADVSVVGNNTEVTFTIVVNNTSIVNATSVRVIDTLPDGLEYVDSTKSSEGIEFSISDNKKALVWIIDELSGPVELFVTVKTTLVGNLTNNVTVTSNENDTPVKDNESVEVVPVILTVNKTVDVTIVGNDTLVTFTIVVNNTSIVNASSVRVIDTLPDGLEYVSSTESGEGIEFSISDNKKALVWIIDELSESVELFVTVRTSVVGNLTNNVTVTSKENDTSVKDNESVDVVPVVLTVNKTVDVSVIGNNTEVTFTIVVNNTSKVNATDVKVVDSLPDGLEFVTASSDYVLSYDNKTIAWTLNQLVGSIELYITVRTADIGNLTNNVTVTSKENDTQVKDDVTVEVVPVILNVTKTADINAVSIDSNVVFTIKVNKTGIIDATNVVIVDTLPEGLEYVRANHNIDVSFSFSVSNDKKTLTWTIPEFTGYVELDVIVKTTALGNFTNNVSLTSNENNTSVADDETVIVTNANLTVVKSANSTNVSVGELVKFTITVNNSGIIDATNISIVDILESAFKIYEIGNETYLNYSDDEKIEWIIPSLNKGNITNVYVIVKVLSEGTFNNTATVTSLESNETKSTTNITAIRIPVQISVGNVTTYHGVNVTIPVNVSADDDVLFNANVTVNLPDGSNQTVEIVNGTGNVTWFVPEDYNGTYIDTVEFEGSEVYLPANGTGNIDVIPKVPVQIIVGNVTASPGTNVTIPITVITGDDTPFNSNLTVSLPDGNTQSVEIINGTGNIIWFVPEDYTPEKYPDAIQFNGSDKYASANGTGVIIVVPKVPTIISVSNITAYPNTEITIPINVTADDNKTFSGNISVTFPDGSSQTVEIINGTGNAVWFVDKNYTSSEYEVAGEFKGNDKYLPSNCTGIISIILVDVEIDISVDKSSVSYGDVVEFSVTVYNNGPGNATEVSVENIIPDGFVYISDNCSDNDYSTIKDLLMLSAQVQSYDASTGVWYIGDLANGEEAKLTILAYANFLGTERVNSTVSIAEVESDYSNNNASLSITVRPIADLKLEKTVDKTKINVGDKVTYTFTVTNNGPNDATGVKLTDSGLTKFEFVSVSSNDYNPATGVWTIGNLTNASSVTLTVTVIINEAGIYPNTASVSANENDTDMSNNNASSEDVNVTEKEEPSVPDIDKNNTDNVHSNTTVSAMPETGNPVFMALFVLLTLILLPLRRRR